MNWYLSPFTSNAICKCKRIHKMLYCGRIIRNIMKIDAGKFLHDRYVIFIVYVLFFPSSINYFV